MSPNISDLLHKFQRFLLNFTAHDKTLSQHPDFLEQNIHLTDKP